MEGQGFFCVGGGGILMFEVVHFGFFCETCWETEVGKRNDFSWDSF